MIPYFLNPLIISYKNSLRCIAKQANSIIKINAIGLPNISGIQYRLNFNSIWKQYNIGTEIILENINDYVLFRNTNTTLSLSLNDYIQFSMTGLIEISGNIQSMLNYSKECTNYCYYRLFFACYSLISIKLLELPSNFLADSCYRLMFNYCSSLILGPEKLPAINLAYRCYNLMFGFCSSLIKIPKELPAITLFEKCYESMFYKCSSLTYIPVLPAKIAEKNCYNSMFKECISLIGPIYFSLILLKEFCMYHMFFGCLLLNSINVNFTNWNVSNCDLNLINSATQEWLSGVSNIGTFTKSNNLEEIRSKNNIPENWTINNIPYLYRLNYLVPGGNGTDYFQYIYTGYIPSLDGFRIEAIIDTAKISSGDSYFYGFNFYNNKKLMYRRGICLGSSSRKSNIHTYTGGSSISIGLNNLQNNIHIIANYIKNNEDNYTLQLSVNDIVRSLSTLTKFDINSNNKTLCLFKLTIYIFENNTYTFFREYHPFNTIRIRNFKIFNILNECVLDLIPVLDRENIACMYDQINGNFLYNQGTGYFNYN